MTEIIGAQNGIESARRRENEFHPKDPATGAALTAWDTRAHTLQLLVGNTNALLAAKAAYDVRLESLTHRVAALELRPTVPFPASGQATGGAS